MDAPEQVQGQRPVNPFPGLRPFEPDEDNFFFGREAQIDDLLRKLRTNRFLMVTGASGSGKSSLVRSGLIPSLYSGMMANTGSAWRVAIMRPGSEPIENLASALDESGVLGSDSEDIPNSRMLVDVTLRRSTLGLLDAVRQARLPPNENVLLLVDQFEEIFRFRTRKSDEAAAFVKLLLAAAQQNALPVYIVITMRADFIGDCMSFLGLPEAINTGQYLVPSMSRDQLRSAIAGPVAVAGGTIAPRLISQLLNDCGDDPDQLPVLQHALMRSWDYWMLHRAPGEPIDLADYEAIGGITEALSRHAEEAFQEASPAGQMIAERLFKSLTDTSADAKGVRRPRCLHDLAAICGQPESVIVPVIDLFRLPGRSFLVPSASVPLESGSIVDLSHESLMRRWTRLVKWTEQEKLSTEQYRLLEQAARSFEQGKGGLWRSPELDFSLRWREENHPNSSWSGQSSSEFDRAMAFLDQSAAERDRLTEERRVARLQKLRYAWSVAGALALLLIVTALVAVFAFRERNNARKNLDLAKDALDSMLSPAGSRFPQIAANSPEVEVYRQRLMQEAKRIAGKIRGQDASQEFGQEIALVDLRLGDGERVTGQTTAAISKYQAAIRQFHVLSAASPQNQNYKFQLADAYNWLGEVQRQAPDLQVEAGKSYNAALVLQEALNQQSPHNADYILAAARIHYNRGIQREADNQSQEAKADFEEAIRLLRPLTAGKYRQELARAENNLAQLLSYSDLPGSPLPLYQDAIQIAATLSKQDPSNRDYKFELAQYYGNLAILLESKESLQDAMQNSRTSVALLEELTQPLSPLLVQLGLAHDIQARILQSSKLPSAEFAYQRSIATFNKVAPGGRNNDFHLWFGQALNNFATLQTSQGKDLEAISLLEQALAEHQLAKSNYNVGWDYVYLIRAYRKVHSSKASLALQSLRDIVAQLSGADQSELQDNLSGLEKVLH